MPLAQIAIAGALIVGVILLVWMTRWILVLYVACTMPANIDQYIEAHLQRIRRFKGDRSLLERIWVDALTRRTLATQWTHSTLAQKSTLFLMAMTFLVNKPFHKGNRRARRMKEDLQSIVLTRSDVSKRDIRHGKYRNTSEITYGGFSTHKPISHPRTRRGHR